MKILLIQPIDYLGIGGSQTANRGLLEGLAERGHSCRAIVSGFDPSPEALARLQGELTAREIPISAATHEEIVFTYKGVEVHAVLNIFQICQQIAKQIREFAPTWTLVSDDMTGTLLRGALEVSPHVVFIAHSPVILPFGPGCFMEDPAKTALLEQAAGIITVSNYMQERIRHYSKLESVVIRFPSYGAGPFPAYGRFEQGFVTFTNPSAAKGLAIFAALAQQLPDIPFAAVPSWGTTRADLATLNELPNVHILAPSANIDDIMVQTRVQLVPSLGNESFGQIVVEAMLRGIPVLSSDSGGLPEAKLGVDYLLPINPIQEYQSSFDERSIPIPVIPDQSNQISLWKETLQTLLADHDRYDQLSKVSREAAHSFVASLSVAPFEDYLCELASKGSPNSIHGATNTRSSMPAADSDELDMQVQQLAPEKRTLLALQLSEQWAERSVGHPPASAAFPGAARPRPDLPNPYTPARNEIEHRVIGVCQDLLHIAPIGIYDNFGALGGHFMLVMQVIMRLREALGVEVPVDTFFAMDLTPATLAGAIECQLIAQADRLALSTALHALDAQPAL